MALDAFQQVHRLGAGEHANARWSTGVSKRQANHIGFVFAFIRLVRIFGTSA